MAHDHSHHHHHEITVQKITTAYITGIALNLLFVIIEVIAGLMVHSLSLLSDAGHNLADVGALGLSLLAFRLLKVKPNQRFTYGYKRTSILVALFNGSVLLVSIGAIVIEATQRYFHPEPLPGKTVAIVAGIGMIINAATALLFMKDKEKDLNTKSAYLHLMSDALVSLGIVAGGILISLTGYYQLDSILSIVIAVVIFISTWSLLRDSFRLSLDAVPNNINLDNLRAAALKITGVKDIHHIHVWALSTTENALTAHLVLEKNISPQEENQIKHQLRHTFEHEHIHHSTLETERENQSCEAADC